MSPADHISYSEIRTFERCKRLHWYTYELGWAPKREEAPLAAGRIMHALLARYYHPRGVSWYDECGELRSLALDGAAFDEERDAIRADFDLYFRVMERYQDHYPAEAWEPVYFEDAPLVEREIMVPLPSGTSLKIRVDLVARDLDSGLIWVWDHKTKKEFDRDMEARLDFDPQLSIYTVGLRALGINVAGGLHNYLRMRLPAVPKINKDGTMSRVAITTDEDTVRGFIEQSGAKIPDDELDAYLAKLPQDAFFRRYMTIREDHELMATAQDLEAKIQERALARQYGLMTRTLIRDCMFCPFYRPCLTALKGGDEELVLAEQYIKKEEPVALLDPVEGGES